MADSLARGETGEVSGESDGDLKARLALAEERLDFYASFDRLIQDNVAQASRLMRDALELRERTQSELDKAKSQAEERFAAERNRYRHELEAVHADLLALQATAAGITRRVAATIGAMNANEDLVASGTPSALTSAITTAAVAGLTEAVVRVADGAAVGDADEGEAAEAALTLNSAAAPVEPAVGSETRDAPRAIEAEMAALGAGEQPQPADPATASVEDVMGTATGQREEGQGGEAVGFPVGAVEAQSGQSEPTSGDAGGQGEQSAEAAVETAPAAAAASEPEQPVDSPQPSQPGEVDTGGPRSVTVLVHGVPRAAAALALQRHLHGLSHVESVEAREYAEGVLRLHVVAGGRLGLEDLQGWEAGAGMEPVTVSANVLEVRLPGAQGI